MRGRSWKLYSTVQCKDPQIVRDFTRLSDKPGITIFMCRSAHEYTLNAFFTLYLNWSKVPFLGFSISLPHRSTYTNKSDNLLAKSKIVSRGCGDKQTF